MSDPDVKKQKLALIFRYGRLAMQWTQTRDNRIRDELRRIDEDLGMTAEEIMDEAMRNTDRFRPYSWTVGQVVSRNEKDSDRSDQ